MVAAGVSANSFRHLAAHCLNREKIEMLQPAVALLSAKMILMWSVGAPLSASKPAAPDSRPDATVASSPEIEQRLALIREKHKVPGLVAGIVRGDKLTAAGATGIRKLESSE